MRGCAVGPSPFVPGSDGFSEAIRGRDRDAVEFDAARKSVIEQEPPRRRSRKLWPARRGGSRRLS